MWPARWLWPWRPLASPWRRGRTARAWPGRGQQRYRQYRGRRVLQMAGVHVRWPGRPSWGSRAEVEGSRGGETRRGGGRTDELAERGERGRACGTTGQLPRVPAAAVRVWTAARTVVVWAGVRGAGWQVGRRDGSQGGARCCVAPALALGRCQPWPSAARVRLGGRKSWPPSGGRAPAACRLSPIHPSSSGLLSHPQ